MCPLTTCVLLLYMCPLTIYLSSYYICVRRYLLDNAEELVLWLYYMCPLTIYVSSHYICVLLLYMCPLTIYVSSYYTCPLITCVLLLYMCPLTIYVSSYYICVRRYLLDNAEELVLWLGANAPRSFLQQVLRYVPIYTDMYRYTPICTDIHRYVSICQLTSTPLAPSSSRLYYIRVLLLCMCPLTIYVSSYYVCVLLHI
jgi:hypothetical protein